MQLSCSREIEIPYSRLLISIIDGDRMMVKRYKLRLISCTDLDNTFTLGILIVTTTITIHHAFKPCINAQDCLEECYQKAAGLCDACFGCGGRGSAHVDGY